MNSSATLLIGIIIGTYIYYKVTKRSPFWIIPGPKSDSFILGHICELFQNQVGLQETYGDVVRFQGSFGSNYLMISDPKALQRIFQISGYRWRKSPQRREFSRLTSGKGLGWADGMEAIVHYFNSFPHPLMLPGFSAPEAKNFLPFFSSCAAALCSSWTDIISASSEQERVFNISEWASRAAFDAIGQVAHVAEATAKHLVETKSGLLLEGKNKKDIMSLLGGVKANLEAPLNSKVRLSEEELLAQMRVLLFAGHETTSTTLSFALFELSRLRKEIRSVIAGRGDTEITAQDLDSMPLLGAMVKETLRFHPVVMHLFRVAVEDDALPLSKPILTTGIKTFLETTDGWSGHVTSGVSLGVYANLAAFSAGIRSCIGWRFALRVLELQAFLVELLGNFEFTATPALERIGELEKGSQMPLRVAFARRDDE
ncbi:cytochrome P450 [Lentinula aciculospora]|uniref:Cytochrome P450 n=1 Tax=Lentinula aciculospora TaxID=153920 RepID=A0A9W9A0I8_9AGAR|nr:cytochrome P450 [Lentinula aciculospora]